ncbi:hypothetical protein [Microbacterium amylolyticum]|uniref:DUF2993 domain-containing protein n=1 Tax=Microbacterium amylolyticum TaxID=936337 RepID=A0ABS4ZJ74_9MICO|nr:hypothetical protein [Microbacterium amylolyticum]MBP2436531.1 hypothetical protein [Microbacterium amylolyticum]
MDRWPWHLTSEKAWPASGTTVKTGVMRLIEEARSDGIDIRWNGAPGIAVSSSPFTPRANIGRISVDLTGSEITIDGEKLAAMATDWIPDPDEDEVVSRVTGILGEKHVRADPVTINGHQMRVDMTIEDAPLEWIAVRRGGQLLGTFGEGHDDERRATGRFRFSMHQDDLNDLVMSLAAPAVKKAIRLGSLTAAKVSVQPTGQRRFTVAAGIAARLAILKFSARVGFDIELSADGSEITVHHAAATSKRLLSKLALLPLRDQFRRLAGRTVPLGDDELRVHGVTVDVTDNNLTVAGRVRAA